MKPNVHHRIYLFTYLSTRLQTYTYAPACPHDCLSVWRFIPAQLINTNLKLKKLGSSTDDISEQLITLVIRVNDHLTTSLLMWKSLLL
jgi:hypothetical protein